MKIKCKVFIVLNTCEKVYYDWTFTDTRKQYSSLASLMEHDISISILNTLIMERQCTKSHFDVPNSNTTFRELCNGIHRSLCSKTPPGPDHSLWRPCPVLTSIWLTHLRVHVIYPSRLAYQVGPCQSSHRKHPLHCPCHFPSSNLFTLLCIKTINTSLAIYYILKCLFLCFCDLPSKNI